MVPWQVGFDPDVISVLDDDVSWFDSIHYILKLELLATYVMCD